MGSETKPAEIKKKKNAEATPNPAAAAGLFADVVIVQLLYGDSIY